MYIRDANIIIVVYDISSIIYHNKIDKDSFTHTTHWLNEVKDLKRDDAIFALVGNKLDLDKRAVTKEEAESVAKERKFIFHEVSAKTGTNINNLFYKDIFEQIVTKFKLPGSALNEEEDNSMVNI